MKSLFLILFIAAGCGGEKAKIEVNEIKVQPDPFITTEDDLVLWAQEDKSEETRDSASLVRFVKKDFNWSVFWGKIREEKLLNAISPIKRPTLLGIGALTCDSNEGLQEYYLTVTESYKTSTNEEVRGQYLASINSTLSKCRILPNRSILEDIIQFHSLNIRTDKLINQFIDFVTYLNLGNNRLKVHASLATITAGDWKKVGDYIAQSEKREQVLQFLRGFRSLYPHKSSYYREFLDKFFGDSANLDRLKSIYSLSELSTSLEEYYLEEKVLDPKKGSKRNAVQDLKFLIERFDDYLIGIEESDNPDFSLSRVWERARKILDIININFYKNPKEMYSLYIDVHSRILSMTNLFRARIVNFFRGNAHYDLHAMWFSKILHASISGSWDHSIKAPEIEVTGDLDKLIQSRLSIFNPGEEKLKSQAVHRHCSLLTQLGLQKKKRLISGKLSEIESSLIGLMENPAVGCFQVEEHLDEVDHEKQTLRTLNVNTRKSLSLFPDTIIISPDTNLTIGALNFKGGIFDLSATRTHPPYKKNKPSPQYNGIVIPLVLDLKRSAVANPDSISIFGLEDTQKTLVHYINKPVGLGFSMIGPRYDHRQGRHGFDGGQLKLNLREKVALIPIQVSAGGPKQVTPRFGRIAGDYKYGEYQSDILIDLLKEAGLISRRGGNLSLNYDRRLRIIDHIRRDFRVLFSSDTPFDVTLSEEYLDFLNDNWEKLPLEFRYNLKTQLEAFRDYEITGCGKEEISCLLKEAFERFSKTAILDQYIFENQPLAMFNLELLPMGEEGKRILAGNDGQNGTSPVVNLVQ